VRTNTGQLNGILNLRLANNKTKKPNLKDKRLKHVKLFGLRSRFTCSLALSGALK
jgi:hypothetical protein